MPAYINNVNSVNNINIIEGSVYSSVTVLSAVSRLILNTNIAGCNVGDAVVVTNADNVLSSNVTDRARVSIYAYVVSSGVVAVELFNQSAGGANITKGNITFNVIQKKDN